MLVIKDVGPWNAFMTVTNAADKTCAELWNGGLLRGGRRLLYYDSLGQLGEIIHKDGVFVCFGHVEPE